MKLSIVIVNYNVLSFLRQCLQSIAAACDAIDYEVIIVDNNSSDGSRTYLNRIISDRIRVILNEDNRGFGSAMNQGFSVCRGEYVLILNPDTLVSKPAIVSAMKHLAANETCGGVGVRMMDGQGRYLKESKRGFPSWKTALFKIIGLSAIFPKSKSFAAYYQGHLSENQNVEIPILTGAFLMTRKEILDKLGGFDEQYFMYGEDIDLSYRITQLGYYNYYIGEHSIVHFKGESTRKTKISTTYNFYNSMLLFAKKHYPNRTAYLTILTCLLWLLGMSNWLGQKVNLVFQPLLKFGIYWLIFIAFSALWATIYFDDPNYYSGSYHSILVIIYALVLSFFTSLRYIGKGFFQSNRKAIFIGFIVILIFYSLLPDLWRSSRTIIFGGTFLILIVEELQRLIDIRKSVGRWQWQSQKPKALLLGNFADCLPKWSVLSDSQQFDYIGIVSDSIDANPISVTDYEHLDQYLDSNQIDALTVHMESISMDMIMNFMTRFGPTYKYLLFSDKSMTLLDSPTSKQRGLVTTLEIAWNIDRLENRLAKRAIDLLLATTFTLFSPVLIWIVQDKGQWISNIARTMAGKLTWVGYNLKDRRIKDLPRIKPGVLQLRSTQESLHSTNSGYARNYTFAKDLELILARFKKLGNRVDAHA